MFILTVHALVILKVFLENPDRELIGMEIIDKTGISSGEVYKMLERLEGQAHLTSRWETGESEAAAGKKYRRHYYRITERGLEFTKGALSEVTPRDPAQEAAAEMKAAILEALAWLDRPFPAKDEFYKIRPEDVARFRHAVQIAQK